jgi:hypothetical protein
MIGATSFAKVGAALVEAPLLQMKGAATKVSPAMVIKADRFITFLLTLFPLILLRPIHARWKYALVSTNPKSPATRMLD